MLEDSRPFTFDRVVRLSLTAAVLVGLVWLMGYLSDVLIPFVVALLLAYLLNPLVTLVQRKITNRVAAVFTSLSGIVLAAALLVVIVVPMITTEIGHMGKLITEVVNNSDFAARAAERLPPDVWRAIRDIAQREEVQELFSTDNIWKVAETAARKVLPGLWGIIAGTTSFILGLFGLAIIGLYLVFLMIDYDKVALGWKEVVPPAYREWTAGFVSDFESAMSRYFRAQAAVASLTGVLFAAGFSIIGLPLGILLGLFIGLLNMVPYLQVVGLIPAFGLATVHALETGGGIWIIFAQTAAVFVVVQAIQDILIVPKIMGKATGLRPAIIMLSLSVWGKLLGMLGLLIAIPMTCLLWAYYQRFIMGAPALKPDEPAEKKDSLESQGKT